MAQVTADALADMLEASNMVLMMKPPAEPVDVRGVPTAGTGKLK